MTTGLEAGAAKGGPLPGQESRRERLALASARTPFGLKVGAVWLVIFGFLSLFFYLSQFDTEFMARNAKYIAGGLVYTIVLAVGGIVLAVILALLGALGRLSRNPVAFGLTGFYTSFFRGTPLIVQMFLIYLALPQIGLNLQQRFPGAPDGLDDWLTLTPAVAGVMALGLNYGAYMTEIFRAGIQSVGHGQGEAAEALGMTYRQKMRRVVLPQAFRVIIPPTGNEFIAMMKDTALISFLGVTATSAEIFRRAQLAGGAELKNLEALILVAGMYWVLTAIFTFFQTRLERKLSTGYVRTASPASVTGRRRMSFLKGGGAGGGGAPGHGTILTTDEDKTEVQEI